MSSLYAPASRRASRWMNALSRNCTRKSFRGHISVSAVSSMSSIAPSAYAGRERRWCQDALLLRQSAGRESCSKPYAATLAAVFAGASVVHRSSASCEDARPPRQIVVEEKAANFPEGEMREVRIPASIKGDDGAILVAKVDGKFYATGASCSHYSASLAEGVLARDRMCVVCPWHDAAFDLRTGQPMRGCGLDAIPTYPVRVDESGKVVVEVPATMTDFVSPKVCRRDPGDGRLYVIVGGGAAGVAAADALRQKGFTGRIVLCSEEKHLPYDRPVLSKNLNAALDLPSITLRDEAHFAALDIELRLGSKVQALDASSKKLTLVGGESFAYDAAVVCTGASPRKLPVPGIDLPNVMQLRTPEDGKRIFETCKVGKRVVIVGSSFIGMELASTLKKAGCDISVLGMEEFPFERVLGTKVGAALETFFRSRKIKFMKKTKISSIRSDKDHLVVATSNGDIPADAVVIGAGVVPNADFVSGVDKAKDGSLLADAGLRTSADGLYAAGDVVSYRCPTSGATRRIEHWDVAMSQGRLAAQNMLGGTATYDVEPFFWTSIFGKNLRYVGYSTDFDDVHIEGDLSTLRFVAVYSKGNVVQAVATMAKDPVAVAAGELLRMRKMPPADTFKKNKMKLEDLPKLLRDSSCKASS
eukprot:TRINITY_DN55544_c0_g1_i1.p1 TRINITY_DN55544_c0_g1~~TRINITY_DN55544_c0_g1_i1.p1  ORF type:complete len:662 (-),score=126.97 TRINITY_DN55544_c0_g1_i1:158-2092(-)